MFEVTLWELLVFAAACVGFPLIGAGVVVAIAMPLHASEPGDRR